MFAPSIDTPKGVKLVLASVLAFFANDVFAVSLGAPTISKVDNSAQYFNSQERSFGPSAISAAHQQNAIAISDGKVFVAYFNGNDNLVLARSNLSGGAWKKIVFPYRQTQPNGHRTANVAVSPTDKRIHLAWGMHASALNYVVSKNGNATTVSNNSFNTSLFTRKRNYFKRGQVENKTTYPRFIVGEDNKLLVFYRGNGGSGSADTFMHEYANGNWSARRKVIDGKTGNYRDNNFNLNSNDRNAYFNDIVYRNGRIHLTWTWREVARFTPVSNHDLMHAYSEDNGLTWKNKNGDVVGTSGQNARKININSRVKFKALDISKRILNQCGQTIDGNGNVHIVQLHGGKYHYYRWNNNGNWTSGFEIPFPASARPKIYMGPNNSLLIVAVAAGKLRVYGAEKGRNNWDTWSELYTSSANYTNATGMTRGGKLAVLAQRTPANTRTAGSSRLDLVTFNLRGSGSGSSSSSSSSGGSTTTDQCNTTAQCQVIYGNTATDCRDSRSSNSVCMCGSARCDAGDSGSRSGSSSSSSSSNSSSGGNSGNSQCQVYAGGRAEIHLNRGNCIDLGRALGTLQIWDSDVADCDFRGSITSLNGRGELGVGSNYADSREANLTGTRLRFNSGNGCKFLKMRVF